MKNKQALISFILALITAFIFIISLLFNLFPLGFLISSVSGIFIIPTSLVGIILGIIALLKIKKSRQEGVGFAIAGIAISGLFFIISIIFIILAIVFARSFIV